MRRVSQVLALTVAFMLGSFTAHSGLNARLLAARAAHAQDECQTFAETGKQVCGLFLRYWREHGGLAQQGLPISDVFTEQSAIDGKTYRVQYFERAVFEHHPEHSGTPYEVLLSLVGRETFERKYPAGLPSGAIALQVNQEGTLPGLPAGMTFRVRILGVEDGTEFARGVCPGPPPTAQGKFVVILVQRTNLGNEPGYLRAPRLRDTQGRQFSVADSCVQAAASDHFDMQTYSETVQPGITADAVMVFDVARDAVPVSIAAQER